MYNHLALRLITIRFFLSGRFALWLRSLLLDFVHSPFWISTSRNRLANIDLPFLSVNNFSHNGLILIKKGPDHTECLVKGVVRGKSEILNGVSLFPVNAKPIHRGFS